MYIDSQFSNIKGGIQIRVSSFQTNCSKKIHISGKIILENMNGDF